MESWTLRFNDWDIKEEPLREAILTLGNGFFATRGASEEGGKNKSYDPGTYLAGGYNRLETEVAGHLVENEDMVNWPNWLCLSFRHPGEPWFKLHDVKIISYLQELDLKRGLLIRSVRFMDAQGRESQLECLRLVSMDNPHVAVIKWTLEPLNWSSTLEFRSWVDGSVKNTGVERYRGLKNKHLQVIGKKWYSENIFLLETMTVQSQIQMSQAFRTEVFENAEKIKFFPRRWQDEEAIGIEFQLEVRSGVKTTIEKVMTLFTSKDRAIMQPSYEASRLLTRLPDYAKLLKKHAIQWERIWGLLDIDLSDNIRENRLLRLHIFHLIQTVSLKSIDLDVGVPARGLHGEAYRGHIFWDELFILPFLNLRVPELSRSLLMYRYRRLDEARVNATKNKFLGAMFPWQSGSNGEEESQHLHFNPISGHWVPDATLRQRHINATILYNIWQYYQATDDKEFLSHFGIEMALEISRFWVSALKLNLQSGRYEILNVVGPDEFHTNYPGSDDSGIHNNAYTNYMASWCIRTTIEMFLMLAEDRQKEILNSLELTDHELNQWQEVSRKIYLPVREDGVMNQFDGFEELKDLDWDSYKKKYGNIQRIDRILEAEGDSVNNYKVNKQCDVLMLYYLFSPLELEAGHQWLGYPFKESSILKNINYHLALSTNGSTLSRIVHAWVLSRYDTERSWEWFNRALETDIADIQGGTTSEGIHLGAMAGTVDLVQRCFTGIEVRNEVLWINPKMPKQLQKVRLLIHFRGHSLQLIMKDGNFQIKVRRSLMPIGKIGFQGKIYDFKQGDIFSFSLNEEALKKGSHMENVEELMTINHHCCSSGNSLQEVSKLIEKNNCTEIVIIDNEIDKHPIGIISEHDITSECARGMNPQQRNAKDIMRKIPAIIQSSMDIEQCLRILEIEKLQRAPVVDNEGKYCGMIAFNDIAPLFND